MGRNNISSFPTDPVRIECKECGRQGRYTKATLIEKYGDAIKLPDLLVALSKDCEKRASFMPAACGAIYPELVRRWRESG